MIFVSYAGADILKTAYDTLVKSDITSHLDKNFAVSIKPNLVVERPAGEGATTHPEIVEAVILFLKDFGVSKIKIIESSGVGHSAARAFKICGYEALSKKHGVPLADLAAGSYLSYKHGVHDIEICDAAMDTDFLFNIPVLKAHCQTRLTCCMKNLKGCIPDREKRRFHSLGIHKPVAALNVLVKTGYCLVDGICGDLTFEEGGSPVVSNRIIAGRNPLTIDSYCAELIGYKPDEIEYISYGKKIGAGEYYNEADVRIFNGRINAPRRPDTNRAADIHGRLINADAACSVCYASLIGALDKYGKEPPVDGIYIGQGYKNKSGAGMGIGNCACGYDTHVEGCPARTEDILDALHESEDP